MLKKQIAEIDGEAHSFFWKHRAHVLVDRDLCSEADGVVAIDSQSRWAEEKLMGLCAGDSRVGLQKFLRALADEFREETPVPLVRRPSPLGRTVSVNQAVIENAGAAIAVVFEKLCVRGA